LSAHTTLPFDTSNRFGVATAAGDVWLVSPPEPAEPLDRSEVLNLIASLAAAVEATPEEIEAARVALRAGPDGGPKSHLDRLEERAAARRSGHLRLVG
jgi:hypothetical protein